MKKRPLQLTATLLQLFFATVTVAVDSQTTERVSEAAERVGVDALPRTAFFATDAAVARGEPGTLIRSEEFAGYDLPADVRATRILYRSRSELDHEVVASAVVIVPTRAAPTGGWPVVIWAHGVTGELDNGSLPGAEVGRELQIIGEQASPDACAPAW